MPKPRLGGVFMANHGSYLNFEVVLYGIWSGQRWIGDFSEVTECLIYGRPKSKTV